MIPETGAVHRMQNRWETEIQSRELNRTISSGGRASNRWGTPNENPGATSDQSRVNTLSSYSGPGLITFARLRKILIEIFLYSVSSSSQNLLK